MADNVAVTPGVGATIATDDVAGVQFQKVKVDVGGDGVSAPLVLGAAVSASSLPVVLASDQAAVPITDNAGSLTVDGTVAVTSAGITTLASAVHLEDDAAVSGDAGVFMLAVRNDAGTVAAGTTGDYIQLSTNSSGNLRTVAVGSASEDSAIAGNPVPNGLRSAVPGTPPADMSAAGDVVYQRGTLSGATVVSPGQLLKSITGSASATFTAVAAVASKKIKVYSLSLITASTTAVTVTFKDGAAGTAKATYPLQAITGTNFGIAENLGDQMTLWEGTVNTLLEMSFSAAQTVTYNIRYFEEA